MMRSKLPCLFAVAVASSGGCGAASPPATPPDPVESAAVAAEPVDQPVAAAAVSDPSAAPEGTDALAQLLRARHARDLPSAEVLGRYPSAEQSLQWLVRYGDPLVVQVRAAKLLAGYPSAASLSRLLEVLDDPAKHPALRAAAVEGTAGQPLDDDLRAALQRARGDADRRVRAAATNRLEQTP